MTLISFGRSGTSLISSVLDQHREVEFVGETAQTIFFAWMAAEQSSGVVRMNADRNQVFDRNAFSARAVQGLFSHLFPSQKRFWLHKPIGIPQAIWHYAGDDFPAWYWNVLHQSFPGSRMFTILRNPVDVAVSARLYWGFDSEEIVQQLAQMAELIIHPYASVSFAVNYHDFASEPAVQVPKLCEQLGIDYQPQMLDAFKVRHVEHRQSAAVIETAVREILAVENLETYLERIAVMWRTFGPEPDSFLQTSKYLRAR
ncbi:sulfotransferase [Rhizobium sp. NFR03]|uniref:sulfotransferase n=1 Tax=Rhizobium sp. NFR03 TaxID=1566263 RepID=UPI00147E7347|nr:sulfotransferase [Rhizobium sp. NFR03]